jgi:hypothetical protein
MEWKLIETAPKDGEPIFVIGFSDNAKIPVSVFWSEMYSEWCLNDGENCYVYGQDKKPLFIYKPTHYSLII